MSPCSASCCGEVGPTPGVLLTTVSPRLPCATSAASRLAGQLWMTPKPPMSRVAPSGTSATAAAALETTLSMGRDPGPTCEGAHHLDRAGHVPGPGERRERHDRDPDPLEARQPIEQRVRRRGTSARRD